MTASSHRTAQALDARRQKTAASLVRIRTTVDKLAASGGTTTMAVVARQADASRTFLYEHPEARRLVTDTAAQARGLTVDAEEAQHQMIEASWRERALNTEDALKAALAEIANQRKRIAELLGQIAELQLDWTDADVVRVTTANVALRREIRALTNDNERLSKRLTAARDNARFPDRRIAALEATIAEQLMAPPADG
ncbi:hypothetical protein [Streptomyces sp. NPDC017993]|uniref:hypothetical protein n=1 Tax=Streptomyces sp. NPDC017993 TaxID=3365027 RepID=UPI00378861E5